MSNTTQHVLLVEDNPDERELIQMGLEEAGVPNQITVLEDGQQAVDYLFGKGEFVERDLKEVPELILLDLKLPKLSGFEVLKLIREDASTAQIPVVIFTSSDLQSDVLTGYKLGANSIVTKPVEAEKFMECIRLLGSYWLIWNHPPPRE